MSLGETPPKIMGRFTSPNMGNKKYSGATKSPMSNSSNSGNRNSQARQRLLASKISAPRPINLPSLRRENASGVEIISSPGSSHGWGSPSGSPSFNRSEIKSTDSKTDLPSSPLNNSSAASTPIPNVWANSSILASKLKPTTKEPQVEPTLDADPAVKERKDLLNYTLSDLNHQSWDEMVSEDLDDFSVNVIEFDDGTKVPIDVDPKPAEEEIHKSAPLKNEPTDEEKDSPSPLKTYHHAGKSYRDSSYNNNNYRHHNTEKWHRRDSSENKRSNYPERKSDSYHSPINGPFHPTQPLEQHRRSSEHSFKSNHSREDNEHIQKPTSEHHNTVPKRPALSAVEQAKKRRDEQEAEYKAAAERARQKAAALAAEAQKRKINDNVGEHNADNDQEPEPSVVLDTSKPWNLIAAKSSEGEDQSSSVSHIRHNSTASLERQVEQLNLKKNTADEIVEIIDFSENEDWGTIPDHLLNGRHRERGWVKADEHSSTRSLGRSATGRGRGRGSISRNSTDHWRQPEEPVVIEILKHEPVKEEPKEVILSYREKIDNLLKNSTSPLLPEFAAKLLTKKPANLRFMVDIEDSDAEITKEYTEEVVVEEETDEIINASNPVDEIVSTGGSGTSTPSYYNPQQGDMLGNGVDPNMVNMNPNYPLLVYQYPIAQQSTSEETRHNGFHSQAAPMGVYFMPQQQYNQYMVPYPQAGSQPMYYPTLSWQQPHYNNPSYSPRPHYKPRRGFNKYNEWQPRNSYQSRPYRGRGGYNKRYYQPQEQAAFDAPAPLEDEE